MPFKFVTNVVKKIKKEKDTAIFPKVMKILRKNLSSKP